MKAIEDLLNNYRTIEMRIRSIDIEIQAIGEGLGNLPTISYSEKVSTSRNTSSNIEKELIRAEEDEAKLENIKRGLEFNRMMVDNAIKGLTERELEVIRLRYLESSLSFEVIADRVFLGRTTIQRTNKKALEKLKRIIHIR